MRSVLAAFAMALALVFGAPSASAQNFTDTSFTTGWTTSVHATVPAMPTASASVSVVNGQRRVQHNYVGGQAIFVRHIRAGANHAPAGRAITNVFTSYRIWDVHPGTPPAVGYAPLLRQGGRFYAPPVDATPDTITTFTHSLGADDFDLIGPDGTRDSTQHPDFSCAGAPIRFGYLTLNSSPSKTQPAQMTESFLDDWSVSLTTLPCNDVSVLKSADGPVAVGQNGNFSFVAENKGQATVTAASGVVVTDLLPANFYVPAWASAGPAWNCTVAPSTTYLNRLLLTCTYVGPPVPPNGAMPPIPVTALAVTAGSFENCARIAMTPAESQADLANNTSCLGGVVRPPLPPCQLAVRTTTTTPTVAPGALTNVRITVGNISAVECETARVINYLVQAGPFGGLWTQFPPATMLQAFPLNAANWAATTSGFPIGSGLGGPLGTQVGAPVGDIYRVPNVPLQYGDPPKIFDYTLPLGESYMSCAIAVVNIVDYQALRTQLYTTAQHPAVLVPSIQNGVGFPIWAANINDALAQKGITGASCVGFDVR